VGLGRGVLFSGEKMLVKRDFGWVLMVYRKICGTAPEFALLDLVVVYSPEV
jgi:hypothetical protein